jgi:hypothetical protein
LHCVQAVQLRGQDKSRSRSLQDVHGRIHPHAEIFPDGRKDPQSGGLAKLTKPINRVRSDDVVPQQAQAFDTGLRFTMATGSYRKRSRGRRTKAQS